jgi:ribulose 1,5-bisphosphate synthetase/thiazole synthase
VRKYVALCSINSTIRLFLFLTDCHVLVEELDLVVIGGGPGGYVAAIKAAQLGLKVKKKMQPSFR